MTHSPSFADCGGPWDLSLENTKTNWESLPTTDAERAIIQYLEPQNLHDTNLLHVGIGNGELLARLGTKLAAFTGITISAPELQHLARLQPASPARFVLANKHDPRSFSAWSGSYDLIVDVNLKSFACCQKHFDAYVAFLVSQLAPRGQVVTAQSGADFGWHGVTTRGYTPGMMAGHPFDEMRVLGLAGLEAICRTHRLTLTAADSGLISSGGETIWLLEKGAEA